MKNEFSRLAVLVSAALLSLAGCGGSGGGTSTPPAVPPPGINLIETRLATTADGGLNWQDSGVLVNEATSLTLPAPNDVNAIANEVSRLVYNPFAVAAS